MSLKENLVWLPLMLLALIASLALTFTLVENRDKQPFYKNIIVVVEQEEEQPAPITTHRPEIVGGDTPLKEW